MSQKKEPKFLSEREQQIERLLRNSEIRNGAFIRYYGKESEIILPDDIVSIAEGAFRGNRNLISLTLGRGVEVIHEEAFRDCVNLRQVNLNAGLITIGEAAFRECSSLLTVSLPRSVRSLDHSAFRLSCRHL